MKFVKLSKVEQYNTANGGGPGKQLTTGECVWIRPDEIRLVEQRNGATHVVTSPTEARYASMSFMVAETPEQIMEAINGSASRR